MENDWWRNEGEYMENQARGCESRYFYQAIRRNYGPQQSKFMPQMIRKLDGSLTNNPKAVKDRWKEYCCEDKIISWELNVPPTMDEMDKALKTLKNHKLAGDDF